MLLTIREFRERVRAGLPALILDLQERTGRRGDEEAAAWAASLPAVSEAFSDPGFHALHLYFGERGNLSLEYRLPASSSWSDMVLLGAHAGQPSAAIVELKHWDTHGDLPGPAEALVNRRGELWLHPSDQVRGYTEYCQHFHSAVMSSGAAVHGCVLFTTDCELAEYSLGPHDTLARDYPCFSVRNRNSMRYLVDFFQSRLTQPDLNFAERFEAGWYEQNRSFVANIGATLARSTARPLVLLDNQRFGFALAKAEIERAIFGHGSGKKVIVVEGPPGSGKSAIAAKIWASLASDERLHVGRFVFTSTSSAQETNWKHLIRSVVGSHGAGGVVMPANKYAPAPLQELIWWKTHRPGALKKPALWRENLRIRELEKGPPLMPDDHLEVSVVDEAHALINPEQPRAVTHSGWPNPLGPQAYHIIRASRVSIFFLDQQQRFRERESTSQNDIEEWARELGAGEVVRISLEGAQFRCGGSTEYVAWIEALLAGKPASECRYLGNAWRRRTEKEVTLKVAEPMASTGTTSLSGTTLRHAQRFEFTVCDTPAELESFLRFKLVGNTTGRLVASFARPWKTVERARPHDLPAHEQDFFFRWQEHGRNQVWARPWNVIPRNDYSSFIQAAPGTHIAHDQLAEVGCTYAVRGFDFDYVGLLWLRDLRWEGGQWVVDLAEVFETGLSGTLKSARRRTHPDPKARQDVLDRVRQAYRILLTRAIKGVFIWCEDPDTREHLRSALPLPTDPAFAAMSTRVQR